MGVAGRPQAAGGAETGGALAGSAGVGTASAAGASRSVTPSAISTVTTTTAGAGNATLQHQGHAQQPAQAPQPSGRVEVKAPPFVCRGRQFVLHEPPMDEDQRQRIRSAIRNRMIGDALAKVRQHDEDYARASRAKSVLATKALLERQELELAARLRNLEQQKDTLKLLLEQIEHEGGGDDAMEGDAVES